MTEKITWAMLIGEIHDVPELEELLATSLNSALLKSNIGPAEAISMQGLSKLIYQDSQHVSRPKTPDDESGEISTVTSISPLTRFFINTMAIVNSYGFHEFGQIPEENDKYLSHSVTTILLERLEKTLLDHSDIKKPKKEFRS